MRYEADATEQEGESVTRKLLQVNAGPDGYRWTRDQITDDEENTTSGTLQIPDGMVAPSTSVLLAALIDWSTRSDALRVPLLDQSDVEVVAGSLLLVSRRDAADGSDAEAIYVVELTDPTEPAPMTLEVSGGKTLRMIMSRDPLVQLVAGSAAEAVADLTDFSETVEQRAVRDVAATFLLAFLTGQEEQLRDAVDWAALKERFLERNPTVAVFTSEAFSHLMIAAAVKRAQAVSAELARQQVALIKGVLLVTVAGDTSSVSFSGRDQPLEFARGEDGRWRLHWWDAFLGNQ